MSADLTLTYGSLNLTATPYLLEFGMDVGAPQNTVEALAFLLQDGEVELSTRASNRTFVFTVLLEGANLAVLAEAEAALVGESEKPLNTVTVDPGDGAPATVFETYRAQVVMLRDDEYERNGFRAYQVTVKAMPSGRSVDEVTADALPTSGTTTTLVNNGSATTNWTGTVNGVSTAMSVVSGAVGITTAPLADTVTISETYTASITTSATPYLVIDWKAQTPDASPYSGLRAYSSGVELEKISEAPSPTSGFTRSYFVAPGASITVLRLDSTSIAWDTASITRALFIDNINRTDVKPSIGTARQQVLQVPVVGSARTQGALAVESTTASLGDVLVYVYPSDDDTDTYVPALRSLFRSSGGTVTTNTALVSGASESLTGAGVTFQIPATQLPRGTYLIVARLSSSSPGTPTISYSAGVVLGGSNLSPVSTGSTVITTGSIYQNYALGRVTLPTVDLSEGSPAVQSLTLSSSTACTLDEVWLFNRDIGQLVQVSCGTDDPTVGGFARRLFIEPATVSNPRPTVRVGHSADRSDAYFRAVPAWQTPQFDPPLMSVFVVTSNATDAGVTLRHYPRWHTNAAS